MKKCSLTPVGKSVFAAILLWSQSSSYGVTIASQGFEAEPTPSTASEQFVDPDTSDHALADQALENVISAGIGGELGFSAFHSSIGSTGHTDGDDVGVHSVAQISFTLSAPAEWPGAFADSSSNGYLIGDPDGTLTITFDTVDLSLVNNASVSLDFLAAVTSWETSDVLHVQLTTNLGSSFLLDINDGDTLDAGTAPITEGVWSNLMLPIPDAATFATLEVELTSNSNNEAIIFDNIVFQGDVVPEPSAPILLAASCAFLLFRRRR